MQQFQSNFNPLPSGVRDACIRNTFYHGDTKNIAYSNHKYIKQL